MGLFSSIGKAFKKVFKGIGKVFKAIGKGIKKVVKGIGAMVKGALKGDLKSILMIAAAVYTGGAMLGAWSSPFAAINGVLAPGAQGAASYANAIGASATGAGSQASMLAAQTAEFGAAGLAATAESAAFGGASTALGAITGNMPNVGFDAASQVTDPNMSALGQEGAQSVVDPLDPLGGGDASWGINQRPMDTSMIEMGDQGMFQLQDPGFSTMTEANPHAWANTAGGGGSDGLLGWVGDTAGNAWEGIKSGAAEWAQSPVSNTWDIIKDVPSPVWSFASGLFTEPASEAARATAQAGWEAKKNQMDYSSPGYVPTVRPSGQGLLNYQSGNPNQRPSIGRNILPPEQMQEAQSLGLSPYQYLYMKRSGQI